MKSILEVVEQTRLESEPGYSPVESQIALELQIQNLTDVVRQYPIGPYFADFFFPENSLVLEIDGRDFHSSPEQVQHDRRRDVYMRDRGYCILRVTGRIAKNFTSGVISIAKHIKRPGLYFINTEEDIKEFMILCAQEL